MEGTRQSFLGPGRLCREIQLHMITTNCLSFMWLTCDQAVLLRQLSRSPRKKKNARLQVTRETTTWEIPFFFFYSVHFVYFIWRNSWQPFSFRWTNMRLFPPFFPKSESKVLPRLAIEGRIVAFSLDTKLVLSFTLSQSLKELTYSFTTQYLSLIHIWRCRRRG